MPTSRGRKREKVRRPAVPSTEESPSKVKTDTGGELAAQLMVGLAYRLSQVHEYAFREILEAFPEGHPTRDSVASLVDFLLYIKVTDPGRRRLILTGQRCDHCRYLPLAPEFDQEDARVKCGSCGSLLRPGTGTYRYV